MQISKFSDYALRILVHLAIVNDQRLSTREIANAQELSFNHLAKISQWLNAEGYVDALRGRGGGMVLAKKPSEISIGKLLRKLEAGSPLVECLKEGGSCCAFTGACGLVPMLIGAQEAFFAYLDPYTLEDAVHGKYGMAELVRSLHISHA
jgi:Rrf2 family transcriptional regulator, nitric oxide-sensitive transcriptional repressor